MKKESKVFRYDLKGSRLLLADERNKKIFLDCVSEMQREESLLTYAFCVTDEEAYFIIEADDSDKIQKGMSRAVVQFFSRSRKYIPIFVGQIPYLKGEDPKQLKSLKEIADQCMEIHRIPLKAGYVEQIEDYWWSSYITYRGEYDWGMVDCRILEFYLSA